ncbi:MAG: hypothetical protein HY907_22660 [Deltaproteobacteria bacterium]|nr:hypothetical protein [Deltaproteobacteria bacterium]
MTEGRRRTLCGFGLLAALLAGAWSCGAVMRSPGEQLLVSKCGACHPRPERERFDRAGWEEVLERHRERVPLDEAQRRDVLEWLGSAD